MKARRQAIGDSRFGHRPGGVRARPKSTIGNRRSAFTLLEVVLALGLTMTLVGAVYAFYFHTLSTRNALSEQSETLFAQRRILDLMSEDLRSAINVALLFSFKGSADEISLMRARVPSASVFHEKSFIEGTAEDDRAGGAFALQADYELVRYYLQQPDPDDQEGEIGPLIRSSVKALRPRGVDADVDVETVALSDYVRFVYFEYRVGEEWVEQWTEKGIPKSIRITIGAEPLPEDTEPIDYPYATVWREIHIPAGSNAGASRGGGDGAVRGDGGAGR